MRLFGWNRKHEPQHRCLCGAEWVSDHWMCPTSDGMVEIYGLTCPTKGCKANLKEQHQKLIAVCKTWHGTPAEGAIVRQ